MSSESGYRSTEGPSDWEKIEHTKHLINNLLHSLSIFAKHQTQLSEHRTSDPSILSDQILNPHECAHLLRALTLVTNINPDIYLHMENDLPILTLNYKGHVYMGAEHGIETDDSLQNITVEFKSITDTKTVELYTGIPDFDSKTLYGIPLSFTIRDDETGNEVKGIMTPQILPEGILSPEEERMHDEKYLMAVLNATEYLRFVEHQNALGSNYSIAETISDGGLRHYVKIGSILYSLNNEPVSNNDYASIVLGVWISPRIGIYNSNL